MFLIGQYDSPFVRRVAVAMRHYGIDFEHRPHSVFRDAELIAIHNPLRRVPTLGLDDGTVLFDSAVCIEVLDGLYAEVHGDEDERLLLPRRGPARVTGLRACGFVNGMLDKAVALVYEREVRAATDPAWVARCQLQLRQTLAMLERERAAQQTTYWLGSRLSHVDVIVSCAVTFIDSALPGFLDHSDFPALRTLGTQVGALPIFDGIYLPFVIPK